MSLVGGELLFLIWFIDHLFLNYSPPFTLCLYCTFGFPEGVLSLRDVR